MIIPEVTSMAAGKALTVAVKLIRLELRRMAFDRNAYQRYGARYPEAVKANLRSVELGRAVEVLEMMKEKC